MSLNLDDILRLIGLTTYDFAQFRDAEIIETNGEKTVCVTTRSGGGYRGSYGQNINKLRKHKRFLYDYDGDNNYAYFVFAI